MIEKAKSKRIRSVDDPPCSWLLQDVQSFTRISYTIEATSLLGQLQHVSLLRHLPEAKLLPKSMTSSRDKVIDVHGSHALTLQDSTQVSFSENDCRQRMALGGPRVEIRNLDSGRR